MSDRLQLPQNPSVVVRDNCVIICYLDGTETVWGEEETHIDALRIARELEIELRAINYIKKQIKDFIQEMDELLFSVDADENLLQSIIKDGHLFAFRELDSSKFKALKLNEKPEIKEIIMKKLEDFYIV